MVWLVGRLNVNSYSAECPESDIQDWCKGAEYPDMGTLLREAQSSSPGDTPDKERWPCFLTYSIPERIPHRVKKDHISVGPDSPVEVNYLVLDYDLPGHRKWYSDEEMVEHMMIVATLPEHMKPAWWYSTASGSRWVYQLAEPIHVSHYKPSILALMATIMMEVPEIVFEDASTDQWHRVFVSPLPGALLLDLSDEVSPPRVVGHYTPSRAPAPIQGLTTDAPGNPEAILEEFSKLIANTLKGTATAMALEAADALSPETLAKGNWPGWNSALLSMVGQCLARGLDEEQTFSVLQDLCLDLDEEDEDPGELSWVDTLWSMVERMNAAERERRIAENLDADEIEAAILQTQVVAEAPQAFRAEPHRMRMLKVVGGNKFYLLNPITGDYEGPIEYDGGPGGLNRALKQHPLAKGIQLQYIDDKGAQKDLSAAAILEENSLNAEESDPDFRSYKVAVVFEAANGSVTIHPEGHPLTKVINPTYSEGVDQYIRLLGGNDYSRLVSWLASVPNKEATRAALILRGTADIGKTLFAQALNYVFKNQVEALGQLASTHNDSMQHSPLMVFEERIGRSFSSTESNNEELEFRKILAGSGYRVNPKGIPAFLCNASPVAFIVCNNLQNIDVLMRPLSNFAFSDADWPALQSRYFMIENERKDIAEWLLTQEWVDPRDRSKAPKAIAAHILWLWQNLPDDQKYGFVNNKMTVGGNLERERMKELGKSFSASSKGMSETLKNQVYDIGVMFWRHLIKRLENKSDFEWERGSLFWIEDGILSFQLNGFPAVTVDAQGNSISIHLLKKAVTLALGPVGNSDILKQLRVRIDEDRVRVLQIPMDKLLNALDEEITAPQLRKLYHA